MPRAKARAAVTEEKPVALPPELLSLEGLIAEQAEGAVSRAVQNKARISATYIAKGNHLVLLIVRAEGSVPTKRLYLCNIIDVKES